MRVFGLFLLACFVCNSFASQSCLNTLVADARFSTLVSLVVRLNLTGAVGSLGTVTIFAPDNTAWAASYNASMSWLDYFNNQSVSVQTSLITAHVLNISVSASVAATLNQRVNTIGGTPIWVQGVNTNVFITGKQVQEQIVCTEGYVHRLSSVLPLLNSNTVQVAQSVPTLSTLVAAVVANNLVGALSDANANLTVFAPLNSALGSLPGVANLLLAQYNATATAVLTYHVLGTTVGSFMLANGNNAVPTLQGSTLNVQLSNGTVTLNSGEAVVVLADVYTSNGVVHVISTPSNAGQYDFGVVLPPSLKLPDGLVLMNRTTVLSLALSVPALASALSGTTNYTVFAPSNQAFVGVNVPPSDLPAVLQYHILNGRVMSSALANDLLVPTLTGQSLRVNLYPNGAITFNGVSVATFASAPAVDFSVSNGVLHFVNGILTPPNGSVAQIAIANNFSTLVSLLSAANLVTTFNGSGNFTVFAPTNAAFAALEVACPGVSAYLTSNITALVQVLGYHVLTSTWYSAGLTNMSATTLQGSSLNISVTSAGVRINTATVTQADISATNGVVHVIDAVLVPPVFTWCSNRPNTTSSTSASTTAPTTTSTSTVQTSTSTVQTSTSTVQTSTSTSTPTTTVPTTTTPTTSGPSTSTDSGCTSNDQCPDGEECVDGECDSVAQLLLAAAFFSFQ